MTIERQPNLDDQKGYYSGRWNAFVFGNKLDLGRVTAALEMLERAGFETPPAICDLGCGAGWATSIFGLFGPATGVDLSDTTLASRRYPHCTFISANILEWDGAPESFDVVMSLEVIEHIERPVQSRYIDVVYRLLKPGGHLILTTPNADTMRAMAKGGREWSNQPLEEWLTPAELRRLLEPRFHLEEMTSIISGFGVRGGYRLMNSVKLGTIAGRLGAGRAWDRLRFGAMYGLHLVAHARKPFDA